MGDFWFAYSPWSGLTTLLNVQSAAILELVTSGCVSLFELAAALAESTGDDYLRIETMVRAHLPDLRDAGLLDVQSAGARPVGVE